jgi:Reverse transcriptase (RNA-dependent DNA polymerase)
LDDILIYSDDPSKHTEYVQKVIQRLRDVGLYADIKKCEFLVIEVKYLRLIVTTKGVCIDPKKVYIITK